MVDDIHRDAQKMFFPRRTILAPGTKCTKSLLSILFPFKCVVPLGLITQQPNPSI